MLLSDRLGRAFIDIMWGFRFLKICKGQRFDMAITGRPAAARCIGYPKFFSLYKKHIHNTLCTSYTIELHAVGWQ